MQKRWRQRTADPVAMEAVCPVAGGSDLLARVLVARGIDTPAKTRDFLQGGLHTLHEPQEMLGMEQAVNRVLLGIAERERIRIYGDYDVDGTTATALLVRVLEMLGAQVDYRVPNRVRDGYGLNRSAVEQAIRDGVGLLLTVDNGIRAHEALAYAAERTIDVIVTDHHLPDTIPPAFAVLNPSQPGCRYPDKNLSGAGVAFKLAHALLRERGFAREALARLLASLTKIAALGTIADMVPLVGENRVIATRGLEESRDARSVGVRALMGQAGLRVGEPVRAGAVGFRIGPRINAAGRLDDATQAVELLLTEGPADAARIAARLDELNTQRQGLERAILAAVREQLGELPPPPAEPFLVLASEGWHPGVVGIVASRVVELYGRPTLLLSVNEDGVRATGSARSVPGYHILEALQASEPLLERFGGHAMAAGATVRLAHLDELRTALQAHAAAYFATNDSAPVLWFDAEISLQLVPSLGSQFDNVLPPYGLGNPAPVFVSRGVEVTAHSILKEKHLKLTVSQAGKTLSAIGWRMADYGDRVSVGSKLDLAYTIEEDSYRGGWQLIVNGIELTEA